MKTVEAGAPRHGLVLREGTKDDLVLKYSAIKIRGIHLKFADAGRVSRKRVETLTTKEPSTLAWLDSFEPGEILFDVGANVGMYTVWAAALNKTQVFAFEPEALNYAELNKNLYLNELHGLVTAFCCGVSDRTEFTRLYLSKFIPAYSHHDCKENRWEGPVTKIAKSQESRLAQGCVAVSLDELVLIRKDIPRPQHVKIDVDGLEALVVGGAQRLFREGGLKTILIETDFKLKSTPDLIRWMEEAGWKFSMDQVCAHRDITLTEEQWYKRLAEKKGGCNIIWFRDADFYLDYFRERCAA